tara:strand:+ start:2832 stop:2966 length:135 start_codon:yes stop_codon:yes gene_type:complete
VKIKTLVIGFLRTQLNVFEILADKFGSLLNTKAINTELIMKRIK